MWIERSPVVTFNWLGWRATSLDLFYAGWDVAVEEDAYRRVARFALRRKTRDNHNIYGVSNAQVSTEDLTRHPGHNRKITADINIGNCVYVNGRIDFRPMDPIPQVVPYEEYVLDDTHVFKSIPHTADILLREASLNEVLAIAKSKQDPKQAEIRARMLKDEEYAQAMRRENSQVRAQLRLVV